MGVVLVVKVCVDVSIVVEMSVVFVEVNVVVEVVKC